ncbi:MAG TPA: succinate dehydrogenase, cytochrome b556 subunit [bacterium]|nr:succinate dehydrogenase, cytochrome b556 subunit [bacterium]
MTALVGYVRRTLLPLVNPGTVAWLLHRVTGVALALYLIPHFVSIHAAIGGRQALDGELAGFRTPLFAVAEWLLIGAVAFHAFNGLRIIAVDCFDLTGRQRLLFWLVLAACAAVFVAASTLFVPRILAPM